MGVRQYSEYFTNNITTGVLLVIHKYWIIWRFKFQHSCLLLRSGVYMYILYILLFIDKPIQRIVSGSVRSLIDTQPLTLHMP
jgi:hypothetical protein